MMTVVLSVNLMYIELMAVVLSVNLMYIKSYDTIKHLNFDELICLKHSHFLPLDMRS